MIWFHFVNCYIRVISYKSCEINFYTKFNARHFLNVVEFSIPITYDEVKIKNKPLTMFTKR